MNKPPFDGKAHRPIIKDKHHDQHVLVPDRLGGKLTLHDRLGPIMSPQLEEMANNLVPNDEIFLGDRESQLIHHNRESQS